MSIDYRHYGLLALCVIQSTALFYMIKHHYNLRNVDAVDLDLQNRIKELEKDIETKEILRRNERKGRVSAEKELSAVVSKQLNTINGFFSQPIGTIRSCFNLCVGTPRQGSLAPATRGCIKFFNNVSPVSLDGLEQYSHVWILFVFHQNTNSKNSKAHEGLHPKDRGYTFRAKIVPPLLKERVGIFSTRTPHRPNPIGTTLAKIESVDCAKRCVFVSGIDLVDSTPILDIKPYVPQYDCVKEARVPYWINTPQPAINVKWFHSDLKTKVQELSKFTKQYKDKPELLIDAIMQVLHVDVRSSHQTKKMTCAQVNYLYFDKLCVLYKIEDISNSHISTNDTLQSSKLQEFQQYQPIIVDVCVANSLK